MSELAIYIIDLKFGVVESNDRDQTESETFQPGGKNESAPIS